MKIHLIVVIAIICGALLMGGYRLSQSEEIAEAAPVLTLVKAPVSNQATTLEEVEARAAQSAVEETVIFDNEVFGYHLSYPVAWEKQQLSGNVVVFQSPDNTTQVKVEAVGPLPADGLTAFVDRSLGSDVLISRQSLTIHSFSAERVIAFSDSVGGQITSFFVDASDSAYVISGVGEQKAIEMIARSFNAPELIVQR
jgi:hypothetical protein